MKNSNDITKGEQFKKFLKERMLIEKGLVEVNAIKKLLAMYELEVQQKGDENCFEPSTKEEWNKQELLDEAKKRYPVGTAYKHLNSEYTPKIEFLVATESDYHFDSAGYFQNAIWGSGLNKYYGVVYHDGKWAEILKPKFTTEDGVGIYEDMKTYAVAKGDLDIDNSEIYEGTSPCFKYFYHKKNALAYIKKHKEKTLEDYEDILLNDKNLILIDDTVAFKGYFYKYLKEGEPKLYYTKILQLIADDLNEEWVANLSDGNQVRYYIQGDKKIGVVWGVFYQGVTYFKTNELAIKARDILGQNKIFI